jgi:hypothetical protein
MRSQLDECRINTQLIVTYQQLLSDAAYRRIGRNPLLCETADAAAPLRLLDLLGKAAKRAEPKSNRMRIARLVLKAFHAILDALYAYRQNPSANPRFPDVIRKQLVRHLKTLKRTREQDLAASLENLIAEPNLGRDLLWAMTQSVVVIADESSSRDGQAARALLERISASAPADPGPWLCFASTDPDLIANIVDRTINRLQPEDADTRLKSRLRELARKPTKQKWHSAVRLMLCGGEDWKNVARFRAMAVGRTTSLFPDQLPSNWMTIVGEDESRIRKFAKALLDQFNRVAEDKPGRPTSPALQTYANEVNSAYIELTGKHLKYTRPTEKSAPDKRHKTTGQGLEIMTAAIQLVDASFDRGRAETLLRRVPKA